ncbi:MAG: hypothetical protein JETT_0148 [Candidatus Jettenia ecosi]|uniref:Uncharacterized protein n=1 Tax=Candidatus Jettenia ecosi TaxID=2494326 RepID=A0A533QFF7_9BACT|nr:MAG: hypothetical protein JETT_0148 [Candidatus Jettenia ecosi]
MLIVYRRVMEDFIEKITNELCASLRKTNSCIALSSAVGLSL